MKKEVLPFQGVLITSVMTGNPEFNVSYDLPALTLRSEFAARLLTCVLLSPAECMDEFFLHEGKCVQECPSHFYPEDKHCFLCHADCQNCNGPNSDDCTACTFSLFVLYNGMCFEECPEGSYYEEDTKDCQGWQLLFSPEEY